MVKTPHSSYVTPRDTPRFPIYRRILVLWIFRCAWASRSTGCHVRSLATGCSSAPPRRMDNPPRIWQCSRGCGCDPPRSHPYTAPTPPYPPLPYLPCPISPFHPPSIPPLSYPPSPPLPSRPPFPYPPPNPPYPPPRPVCQVPLLTALTLACDLRGKSPPPPILPICHAPFFPCMSDDFVYLQGSAVSPKC